MNRSGTDAPGGPGLSPRWTSSAKSGVGTALKASSRVWFTVSHGILDEIYYPRVDQACTRDLGLIVTGERGFFSEEKRDAEHAVEFMAEGVPAYRLTNTCPRGRYRIRKEVLADPEREVVLQRIAFAPLAGTLPDYHLYALLAPHLANHGSGNTAWIADYKGVPMLFAERAGAALALACSAPWLGRSAGFVGASDGWQDLRRHQRMEWHYERAADGNVALTGEVDLLASSGTFVLALGFGGNPAEAGFRALASLRDGFGRAERTYLREWRDWHRTLNGLLTSRDPGTDLCRRSAMVLRVHEAKSFPGGLIASLSIPWGFAKGDDDLGGYHLVWPRDLVEAAGGLLAVGASDDARRVLVYLEATQEADGHWPQNMWLDGSAYWSGIQMDETALPILLVDLALRQKVLDERDVARLWPMVRRAAGYLVRCGPVTPQDRWEEDPGYSPFTLAVEIAALLAAADLADPHAEKDLATYLRETADAWNAKIERWTYVTDTDLARRIGVDGYYVRIAVAEEADAASPAGGFVPIKNRPPNRADRASRIVSPDALALVRFGLRAPDDPRITNTVKVIDALLKTETPFGPAWYRYGGDVYGEHADGSHFDGNGIGRPWPLLTGERAHFELAAGRKSHAEWLMHTLEGFSYHGMFPEQVWDQDDVPERELFRGRPSGSAMPLAWAHAEHLKLWRSLQDGRVFDMPSQTVDRYQKNRREPKHEPWRLNQKIRTISPGRTLRIETLTPAKVHWSADGWRTVHDTETRDVGLGVHVADLPTSRMKSGVLTFTFYWPEADRWEGTDFMVGIEERGLERELAAERPADGARASARARTAAISEADSSSSPPASSSGDL